MLTKKDFKTIFDCYFDTIRSFAFYRCCDAELASDIAQDVFLKLWEKREQYDITYVKSLLYKMTNDMVISHYRKDQVQMSFEQAMVANDGGAESPSEILEYEELKHSYSKALSEMTESQRTTFLMNRNDGLKYNEIADALNISVKSVEKRISAALQQLKRALL